jgi:cytochrome b
MANRHDPVNPQITQHVVWDPLIRLFHWSLVCFFFLAYLLNISWLSMHSHAGCTIALLILFRILWGFIGTLHARFSEFVTGPSRAAIYLTRLICGHTTATMGHNPAGSMMILTLLASLFLTASTGVALYAVQGSGPLAGTLVSAWPGHPLQTAHTFLADFTLVMIIVHVAGVLVTSRLQKQNLTWAMISGRKNQYFVDTKVKEDQ